MSADHVAGRSVLFGPLALRRLILDRRGLSRLVFFLGLLIVAVGVVLALDGVWAAAAGVFAVGAVLTWLDGVWALPWTADAYGRWIFRIWRTWATETNDAYLAFRIWQRGYEEHLALLSPPRVLANDHTELLALAAQERELRHTRTTSPSHLRELSAVVRASRSIANKLLGDDSSAEAVTYAQDIKKLFADRTDAYGIAADASERAAREALQKLAHVWVPASVAVDNDALREGFEAHLEAARALHQASAADDPDAVREAAVAWNAAHEQRYDVARGVWERLGYPTAAMPTGQGDSG